MLYDVNVVMENNAVKQHLSGHDIKVFEHLPTGQVAPKLYLPGQLIHLPVTLKSV